MSLSITTLAAGAGSERAATDAGLGALRTERGNLPLRGLDIRCEVTGLSARTVLTQKFHNPHAEPIEAEYIFPLLERGAVTDMTMTAADRTVTAELQERGQARKRYDKAVKQGKRAAIAEAERADVFTMRVGNILADETATITITVVGPLIFEDAEATLRMPLVVAPRFIPGEPSGGPAAGDGYAADTDAVPDASRITPAVLLPGFPNPVELSITVDIDPAGLPLAEVSSSLHTVITDETVAGHTVVRVEPGERLNRDFILRFRYGHDETITQAAIIDADPADGTAGTFQVTVLPPHSRGAERPRDVVVLLDRSGSMRGWKMVAARRAAARVVDTLASGDRFAVRCFDSATTSPERLGDGLAWGSDRNRFAAVEHFSRTEARGGTQMLSPLVDAAELLRGDDLDRDRIIVMITDGQVGNEDQILAELSDRLGDTRIHVVGIDRAVNAGFLHRLALAGRGRCELVESQDRLDVATGRIHRRIVAPVVTDVSIAADGVEIDADTLAPSRTTDLFTGVPLVLSGRYRRGGDDPVFTISGTDADGQPWRQRIPAVAETGSLVPTCWARAHLQDLTDRYAAGGRGGEAAALEERIVATSLRYHVLSTFTAFVAIDSRVVTEEGRPRTIVQPVELPDGWEMGASPPAPMSPMGQTSMMMAAPMAPSGAAPAGYGAAPSAGRHRTAAAERAGRRPGKALQGNRSRTGIDATQIRRTLQAELAAFGDEPATLDGRSNERSMRMQLSDLATRLQVLIEPMVAATPVYGEPAAQRLRELVAELAGCEAGAAEVPPAGEALRALWRRTRALLSELATSTPPPAGTERVRGGTAGDTGAAEAPQPPATSRSEGGTEDTGDDQPFWKRRPR